MPAATDQRRGVMGEIVSGQRLKGTRAVVAVAGQEIGRAGAMAARGAVVFARDLNMAALSTIRGANHENTEIFEPDARSDARVWAGIDRAQPDILFNCAGFVDHGAVLDARDDERDFAFDVNVRPMVRPMRVALPGMREKAAGSILNMSFACLSVTGAPNRFIYGTPKAGLKQLVSRQPMGRVAQHNRSRRLSSDLRAPRVRLPQDIHISSTEAGQAND